jgi:adenosylcobinamide-phosphate synthase
VAAGLAVDAVLADPRRAHPVAAFGSLASALEGRSYRDARAAGAVHAITLTATTALLGAAAVAATHARPGARLAVTALATWSVVGGTTLSREAAAMRLLLEQDDVDGARRRLSHLCGRDPAELDAAGLVRATVESVAENTCDAVVGPLVWAALAGVPGLVGYRAVNTLDAMVGHRSPRYERFGWASARADDLANLLPARLTAALTVLAAPVVGGRSPSALLAWRRDGGKHPSPNAGQVEATFAGALGRTLGGALSYAGRVEQRPLLGDGPVPEVADIARAARLSQVVSLAAGTIAVVVRLLLDRRHG